MTRVVGPGLPAEFVPASPGQIQSALWPTYIQNKVVRPTAWVEVSTQMVIESNLWLLTHATGGNDPITITANVTFTLNGRAITQPILLRATMTSATRLTVPPVSMCVPVDASWLRFASRVMDPQTRASIPCADRQTGETTCPGTNEVEALELANYPTGVDFVSRATKVIFRAMAPVVLVTGCCGENEAFWRTSTNPDDFLYGFVSRHIPYSTRAEVSPPTGGMLSGTIAAGAGSLNVQIPAVAREFGSDWVHLVAHSKGGLNSRRLLGDHWLESQGVGVLSLITLDSPHLGSLAGTILDEKSQDHLLEVPGDPKLTKAMNLAADRQAQVDRTINTIPDLRPEKVDQTLNVPYPMPPSTIKVANVTKCLLVRVLASDANVDGSTFSGRLDEPSNMEHRTISYNEGRYLVPNVAGAIGLPEYLYNATGMMTGVRLNGQTRAGPNGTLISIINPVYGKTFQWNDCVVTVNSQLYADPVTGALPFRSLTPTTLARGIPYGNNHTALANSDIAKLVTDFLAAVTP